MHDFILAKEIIDALLKIGEEKKLKKISAVVLEIGAISLSHDGMPEHVDEISLESLDFGLRSLAKGTLLEKAQWQIKKIAGNAWSIKEISGE